MVKVSNRACIRHLGFQSMKAAGTRNLIAILAIALTTVLFTSLFTIALSINEGFQDSNFRQVGGCAHGSFKNMTEERFQELREDPLIHSWGMRRLLGMPGSAPFQKAHVEVSYADANEARWMFCTPAEGRLPQEGTGEAATDLRVLELLGVEPVLGTPFTITFSVDGRETTQTFTLSGWWEYDSVSIASHVLIPESRLNAILAETGVDPSTSSNGMTGLWTMDVMFASSLHIERDIRQVLTSHGYQNETRSDRDTYVQTGINWGYSGAHLAGSADPMTLLAIAAVLLLIIFTGYLIIYNVFQISVSNDIRFYGLLKTIGTTPRQLSRIIRQQALLLCAAGIPLGLLAGWFVGGRLTPLIIARLNQISNVVSVNPVIFLAAALFSLLTVALSCWKPGRMAASVSPVEAVRYTEGGSSPKRRVRRAAKGAGLFAMARANLGRSRGKTVVTILSLSLAVVLLTLTVTFTNGFDMDKYLSNQTVSDFVLADASYFQTGTDGFSADTALSPEVIDAVTAQGGVAEGGRVYGRTIAVQEFITADDYRAIWSNWFDGETLEQMLRNKEYREDGRLTENAQLYGMEPFALDRLEVLEGDLSRLREPDSRCIAAVYTSDDYGRPRMDSHWAKLGDTVTLRYVEHFEYFNPETGEIYGDEQPIPDGAAIASRAVEYRDIDYTVAALVTVPTALSYRYYGADEFVLSDTAFVRDTGTDKVMLYAFDVTDDGANETMETFLSDYTGNRETQYDYESRASHAAEFESLRAMFLMMGGALSFIVGLVGILNFFNAILTGILTRRREFAVLQSVGMTGRQLKTMLVWEGLIYGLSAVALSMVLSGVLGPLMGNAVGSMFWFFTYRFTLAPVLLVLPVFLLLGTVLPLVVYRSVAKSTIVERLRETT